VLRSFLRLAAVYCLILALPVAVVPSGHAVAEWGHRVVLLGGSLMVGAAIAARGLIARSLRWFVLTAAVVSVAAVIDAATNGLGDFPPDPAYPFGIHKNAAGFLVGCALVLTIVWRSLLRLPTVQRQLCQVLFFVGLVACQSRAAAVMVVVLLVAYAIRGSGSSRSPIAFVGGVAAIVVTYFSVESLFGTNSDDARFNSLNSRLDVYGSVLEIWERHPLFGAGLRFWNSPDYAGVGEPHNLVVSALGESGVVGLLALLVLLVGAWRLTTAAPRMQRGIARFAIAAKAMESLLGIYWVAGTLTFSWLLVGMCCFGVAGRTSARSPAERHPVLARG
jgi:O-antigen ligase